MKDPNRVATGSTVGRWFRHLDSAERWERVQQLPLSSSSAVPKVGEAIPLGPANPFPFLQKMLKAVSHQLARSEPFEYGLCVLSWPTLAHFLQVLLPLRC